MVSCTQVVQASDTEETIRRMGERLVSAPSTSFNAAAGFSTTSFKQQREEVMGQVAK